MSKNTISFENNQKNHPQTCEPTLFNPADFGKKQVEVRFSTEQTSHDGGLFLLNEVEKQIGLIDKLAKCINDPIHQAYVHHHIDSMMKQRIMQIAAGYEDANAYNSLKNDGILNRYVPARSTPLPHNLPLVVWKICRDHLFIINIEIVGTIHFCFS